MPKRPNIIILYSDQLRHDAVGALGNPRMQTPNFDRLVDEGVAFTQATTPCPVCMPARWSLHTGQWTTTHRCYSNHHPGPRPATSLPALLREAGYRTGLVGKNHSFLTPDDLDHFVEHPPAADPHAAQFRQAWLEARGRARFPRFAQEAVPGGVQADPDRAKTDEALRFLDQVGGEPFFLWLSYIHPHTPYYCPEPYFSMYEDAPLGPPRAEESLEAAGKPFRQQFHQMNNDALLPYDRETVLRMRAVYGGTVSLLDAEVGRLLDFLRSHNLEQETLIVLMSDHGDYMGDHGLITKSPSLYDCLVRTPLIVHWPGEVPEGVRSAELASHVDVMPTLLRAARCPVPPSVQGRDLAPYIQGRASGLRDVVWSEYGIPGVPYTSQRLAEEGIQAGDFRNPWQPALPWEGNPVSLAGRIRMARTQEWKLVEEIGGTSELYDLRADPGELTNLYGRPEHRAVQAHLQKRLEEWKARLPGIDLDSTIPQEENDDERRER
jgi:arylsulfatase A-like enzyme